MGGILDSARFKYRLAEQLGCSPNDLQGQVIGGHGDTTMIPLIKHATSNSMPVTQFLTDEQQEYVVKETMVGGATLTGLIGTSAWYAPGAAVSALVQSIACDQKKMFPCSALLEGEYGLTDLTIGVPVILGKNGIEKIVEIDLMEDEKALLSESAAGVSATNGLLSDLNLF